MLNIKYRDIASGDFTYGERIQLARIFSSDTTDFRKVSMVLECLHNVKVEPQEAARHLDYVLQVQKDFMVWIEREKKEFYIPPTPEETQAGIEQLSKECGDMGMVVSLARDFHYSFEQVYKMPYLDVFTIQKVDTARAKFERKLSKAYMDKGKSKK